jgi:hypothetical protein
MACAKEEIGADRIMVGFRKDIFFLKLKGIFQKFSV